ncbi:alpha-L-fucosidase [Streptomyces pseudovenezuelae]|uniref:alpha-L-fucosidase n=1 Tax=Streptomyces pseudovenezuelae TaxID=67350 RepID=UPI002E81B3F6|nr:alpha-L-fucosidase [Streptomyces pseudovenezuelae]WUA86346.1 alpha-L-fucosidase [Streptomyces pseudovenezuelae]
MPSSINRRQFLAGATCVAATAVAGGVFGAGSAQAAPSTYTPTWSSVNQHPPAPEWFQDAKFGIYFHWGVFSVPAYDNEWYPRNMYIGGSNAKTHHIATYGDPSVWPYHNFINGANDKAGNFNQFAPRLKSAGGKFDPDEWAQLFVDAGAKFAGPVAEHHDGYSMWDSQSNEWNSVAKGPKLDLLKLFTTAIRAKNLKLLVAMHHAYHFNGFYDHVPAQSDPSLKKFYGQLGATAENQLWYDKLKEVIDRSQPDILWQDFKLDAVDETQRLNLKLLGSTAGTYIDLAAPSQDSSGLTVTLPSSAPYTAGAYVLKLTFSGRIPPLRPAVGAVVYGDVNYSAKYAVLGPGTYTADQLALAGVDAQSISSLKLAAGNQVVAYSGDNFTGTSWTFTADNPDLRVTGQNDQITSLKVQFNPSAYFRITNVTDGLALDSGGNVASGSNLKQYTWDGSPNLQWQLVEVGGGYYKLVNRTNGMVADGWGATSGSAARQAAWTGNNNQQWTVTHRGEGMCTIANRATGLVLDGGGNVASGSVTKQWTYDSSTNLLWTFTAQ